jgi:hypothetical protein
VAEDAWNCIYTEGTVMRGEADSKKNILRPVSDSECPVYDQKEKRKTRMNAK